VLKLLSNLVPRVSLLPTPSPASSPAPLQGGGKKRMRGMRLNVITWGKISLNNAVAT